MRITKDFDSSSDPTASDHTSWHAYEKKSRNGHELLIQAQRNGQGFDLEDEASV
jgi:hypothetical protein